MKRTLTVLLIAAVGATTATVAAASGAIPAAAKGQAFWANVNWDDDDDDDCQRPGATRTQRTPIPVPNAEALRKTGMARVVEVERDDGQIEVEGVDAKGREIEIHMDAAGQRILRIERDVY